MVGLPIPVIQLILFRFNGDLSTYLAIKIRAMAEDLYNLASDMEDHFDEHGDRPILEEDDNAGFDQLMDMDIRGMLTTMRFR
jgi:hypothetical protein